MVWSDSYFSWISIIQKVWLAIGVDKFIIIRYIIFVSISLVYQTIKMNTSDFWQIVTSTQVSTALVLIAVSLVFITLKLYEKPFSKSSK